MSVSSSISFWDAMIVVAAQRTDSTRCVSISGPVARPGTADLGTEIVLR
jgi:hypothetical protein